MSRYRGFTLLELIVVIIVVAFLIALFWPSSHGCRGISRRALCVANVRGIGQSCKIYANDFDESWPIPPHNEEQFRGLAKIGWHRLDGDVAHPDPSIGQAFWIIVKSGGTLNKQFICPSSTDTVDDTANPMTFYDFRAPNNLSYGYLYPYGQSEAKPSEALDAEMPMMADKCFSSVGAMVVQGSGHDFMQWESKQWALFNTPHHLFGGQNVLFQDGHASFEKTTACGLKRDELPRGRPYQHRDLIYDNADGVFGGAAGGWPLDANDSVIVHGPR